MMVVVKRVLNQRYPLHFLVCFFQSRLILHFCIDKIVMYLRVKQIGHSLSKCVIPKLELKVEMPPELS